MAGVFEERKREIDEQVFGAKLGILVWGPGPGADGYAKREKIREELSRRFPRSEVRFSEDPELARLVSGDLTLPEQELEHLALCHLCVVLDTSRGAAEEIAHFVRSAYSHKLMILTHEQYRDVESFPSSLRATTNQVFYSRSEYDSCNLVERVVARARAVALGTLTRTLLPYP